jgi:hypothetical protein
LIALFDMDADGNVLKHGKRKQGMGKLPAVALCSLLLIMAVAFADAPPPMLPSVHISLVNNGQPYAGEANLTYLCSLAENRTIVNSSVREPGDMAINCSKGLCAAGEWYEWYAYSNPCFYSTGRFMVRAENRTLTSQEISLEEGGYYKFTFDIATGALNASEENPHPNPPASPLCPSLAMLGFVAIVALANRGK